MTFTDYCNDSGHELSIKLSKKTKRLFSEAFVIVKKKNVVKAKAISFTELKIFQLV